MDTTRVGIATAKAMEQIDRLQASGDISADAVVGAVTVIVALDSKTPDDAPGREQLRDVATQVFVFTEPDQLYVQMGLIELAKENYAPTGLEDD